MGRPLSVTDDEIIDATERVVAMYGATGLTVSEVARQVGLSRAAITLRFAGAEALKALVLERQARQFEERMASVVVDRGPAGLIAIAEMLGGRLKEPQKLSDFWVRYNSNIGDPLFRQMEDRRGVTLRALIDRAMPDTAIERAAAANAFMAHMSGSMLYWQSIGTPDASEFLRQRAIDWIRLAGIPLGEVSP